MPLRLRIVDCRSINAQVGVWQQFSCLTISITERQYPAQFSRTTRRRYFMQTAIFLQCACQPHIVDGALGVQCYFAEANHARQIPT
jgi:hypothetical protein